MNADAAITICVVVANSTRILASLFLMGSLVHATSKVSWIAGAERRPPLPAGTSGTHSERALAAGVGALRFVTLLKVGDAASDVVRLCRAKGGDAQRRGTIGFVHALTVRRSALFFLEGLNTARRVWLTWTQRCSRRPLARSSRSLTYPSRSFTRFFLINAGYCCLESG